MALPPPGTLRGGEGWQGALFGGPNTPQRQEERGKREKGEKSKERERKKPIEAIGLGQ